MHAPLARTNRFYVRISQKMGMLAVTSVSVGEKHAVTVVVNPATIPANEGLADFQSVPSKPTVT